MCVGDLPWQGASRRARRDSLASTSPSHSGLENLNTALALLSPTTVQAPDPSLSLNPNRSTQRQMSEKPNIYLLPAPTLQRSLSSIVDKDNQPD